MFKNLSIKHMLISIGLIIILGISINMTIAYTDSHEIRESVYEKEHEIMPHLFNFLKLQRDVIQVQQWLTDISATRAKEGFDDGFTEAEVYYIDGNKVLEELIIAHKEYNEAEMVADLKKFKEEFKSFYQIGTTMAKVYIKDGADAGNIHMLKLDPFAEKLTKALESWVKEHKSNAENATANIETKLDELETNTLIYGILLIIFIFVVFSLMSKKILNSLSKFQLGLLSFFEYLNKESDNVIQLDDSSKDELGTMSKVINSNIIRVKKVIEEDEKLMSDANSTINRVISGWYAETIPGYSSNQSFEGFKNRVNDMISATRYHFIDVNKTLEQYVHLDYRNELKLDNIEKGGVFEELINDINLLRNAITKILVENKQNGITLQESSSTLLSNVDILNINSNQAAAALEETAAALEEVTSNISSTTNNVIAMAKHGTEVKKSVNNGQKLASQTTKAMDEINTEVTSISEAIVVIDQIAFQTNILSLNAAVEAATAGEAGKGFAVVAQEVRNLASRSAEAAKEIKELVEKANQKTHNGKIIANEMIDGYSNLNDSISKTLDLISDVESAAKEQQVGIMQINDAINSLDKQTQENANVASQTNVIAKQTDAVAKQIVTNANEKEFIGKDDIKAKIF